MIEIAISLAVIGFALVAILGILPIGMGVQKQNREETIINQDASVFLDAIRNGAHGLDSLTNYVIRITNSISVCRRGIWTKAQDYVYTPEPSSFYPLTTGSRIVGLLSAPGSYQSSDGTIVSNRVVALFRSLSGPASEKYPQDNTAVQDLGFSYRLTPEILPYGTYFDPLYGNPQPQTLQSNLYELRLSFRWPLVDTKGKAGPVQQSFRALVGGSIQPKNEINVPTTLPYTLYFFQPGTYVKAP